MLKNNQDGNNDKERDGERLQPHPHDTQATQQHPPWPQATLMGWKGELANNYRIGMAHWVA